MPTLRIIRAFIWGLAFAALLAAAGLSAAWYSGWFGGERVQAATIGGPFALTTATGAPITDADLRGHPSLIYFGYTYCPEVCPTTLADMSTWLKDLGKDADRVKAYFVTLDPERDTEQQMAAYLSAFDPRIVGITGAPDKIEAMLRAYRVYHKKVPLEGEGAGYLVDHAAALYLFDSKGNFAGSIGYQEPEEKALGKIQRLLKS